MARAIWTGSLSFGLVNVPVKVVTATRSHDVRFNQIHEKDGARIETRRVCSAEDVEVPYGEVIKGYKVAPDQYVPITKEELEQLTPEASQAIEIEDFVDLREIDPVYFERPYYLVPQKGAAKAYRLLVEAMRGTDRVAIARVVMRSKEHLVAVRVVGEALSMTKLLHADEVVADEEVEDVPRDVAVDPKELAMAEQLVEALSGPFEPDKYPDTYREQVLALIEAKIEGREVVAPPRAQPAEAKSLTDALAASLEAARGRRQEAEA